VRPEGDGEQVHLPDPNHFSLSYTDDDGDLVTITADGDVADAVRIARGQKTDRILDALDFMLNLLEFLNSGFASEVPRCVLPDLASVDEKHHSEEDHMKEESADPAKEATWGKKGVVHSHNPPAQELVAGMNWVRYKRTFKPIFGWQRIRR
jgi:hypothetical protein